MSAYAGTIGTVGILNVGAGDTKLSFDKSNPAERIRAGRIVKDMLRRGYALLVEVEVNGEKKFQRAIDFDENVCEYIIADFDSSVGTQQGEQDATVGEAEAGTEEAGATSKPRGRKAVKKRVDAESTRAVSVARTAGG